MSAGASREVLILQHVPWETPGRIAKALEARSLAMHTRTLIGGDESRMPDLDRYAGVVLLGGPMRATDTATHPALALERELAAQAVHRDIPVLGVCLGHQILALALGAELEPDAVDEVGVSAVALHGSALTGGDGALEVLHWHHDNVSLPPGAELLASTSGCANQAFRHGRSIGLQFHLEVDTDMLERWLRIESVRDEYAGDSVALLESMQRAGSATAAAAETVFASFAAAVAAP